MWRQRKYHSNQINAMAFWHSNLLVSSGLQAGPTDMCCDERLVLDSTIAIGALIENVPNT